MVIDQLEAIEYIKETDKEWDAKDFKDRHIFEIQCLKCGSTHFKVARGEYYTAIKCVICDIEICIHE
jgi:uncharacterized OB-fold protein